MTPAIRGFFPLFAADQVLAGGRAPGRWRRGMAQDLAPLHQLARASAWIAPLTGLRPRLNSVPLWGTALALVTRLPPEAGGQAGLRGRPRPSFAGLRGEKAASPQKGDRALARKRSGSGPVPASLSQAVKPGSPGPVPAVVGALDPRAAEELLLRLAGREVRPGGETARKRDWAFPQPAPSAGRSGSPTLPAERVKRGPPSRRQGPGSAPLSGREKKNIEAWQRHVWARVRHSLVHVPPGRTARPPENAAAGRRVNLPGNPPLAVEKSSSPGNLPAGDFEGSPGGTPWLPAGSGHSPGAAAAGTPWQLPVAGETVAREILAALAEGKRPDNMAASEKSPSRGSSASSPGISARGKKISEASETARQHPEDLPPDVAPSAPRPFDRPLRELLHRGPGEKSPFPAGTASFPDAGKTAGFPSRAGENSPVSLSGEEGDFVPEPTTVQPSPVRRQVPSADVEELERLTGQLQRILQEEARRHGIDV